MGIFRIYPTKSNTIASGLYSNINAGQNAVTDLWYGGGVETTLEKRNSYSRFIAKFDLTDLQAKLLSKEINPALVTSYKIKMTNSIPKDKLLEPEFEFDILNKNIAASFDLICFPLNKDFDEGRGYDLTKELYLVKQAGNPQFSGYSNWNNATSMVPWDAPGVYTDPTGSTYSGTSTQSGMTLSALPNTTNFINPTFFNFVTSANTAMTTTVSANTIGNDIFVVFSGLVSTTDWLNSINSTSFSGLGITITGDSSTTYIGNSTFTLSANTAIANIFSYSTQHFDIGNEDINMDITAIVNNWLSTSATTTGLGIAYRRDFELLSTDTRYISSFFTQHTNTAFKPYIEVAYNQSFKDDRNDVTNNRVSRLFLYTFSGNNPTNYFSAGTVSIKTYAGIDVFTGLTPTQLEKGVYYVDVWMSGATKGQQYKDVWQGVTFVPGFDQQSYTQSFTIQDNYYFTNSPQVNAYSVTTYGIDNDSIISLNDVTRVYCDLRVNYSTNYPKTQYDLQYRIVMNNQLEVVSWTSFNQAVMNRGITNYFTLETSWLLHNQTYQIQLRVQELGTSRVLPEQITFRVLRNF